MSFASILSSEEIILAEGAVLERLRRDASVTLDRHVLHTALIYSEGGQRRLGDIYREYIEVGRMFSLPIIMFTPTWRANTERLNAAGFEAAMDVNGDAVRFLTRLRDGYGEYGTRILIGGLLGCKGDAYVAREALSRDEAAQFHRFQIRALVKAGVDFLAAATLPAESEALGLADAMAETGVPSVLSVVLRADGSMLDGTPLHTFVERADAEVSPRPAFYMVNCTHPAVFIRGMTVVATHAPHVIWRVIGLQANTSMRPPEELDGREQLDAGDPMLLVETMLGLRKSFGTRILGGCCGTDRRHMLGLAEHLCAKVN